MLFSAQQPILNHFKRAALVVGHPGHELKVLGWLSLAQPRVYLITDGSGRHGIPRTNSTQRLIARLGAARDQVFGVISDAGMYRAILEQDSAFFLELVDRIAESFINHEISSVVGDAAEGFNPTHDLCRTMINAAVSIAESVSRREIPNFEFCLTEWERNAPEQEHDDRCLHLMLDNMELENKLAAAEAYVELRNEVRSAIASRGPNYFRLECLRRVVDPASLNSDSIKPLYERWGEQRVAEGEYSSVIRFEKHVLPLMETILDHAAQAAGTAQPTMTR
jgi:hypothetical protein